MRGVRCRYALSKVEFPGGFADWELKFGWSTAKAFYKSGMSTRALAAAFTVDIPPGIALQVKGAAAVAVVVAEEACIAESCELQFVFIL